MTLFNFSGFDVMRALLWYMVLLICATTSAAEPGCSRPLRISADQTMVDIATTEEAWFLRFVRENQCSYLLLGSDMSTQRRLQMLASGELDVVLSATFTPDRDRVAYFSAPYRQEVFYFLVHTQHKALPTIDDYLAHRFFLILPRYGVYPDAINDLRRRFGAQHQLNEYKDAQQGFALLNRNSQAVMLMLDGYYEPLRDQYPQFNVLPWRLFGNPLHAMFSRTSTQLSDVERFNDWVKRNPYAGVR